jgi:hypothetical protein
MMRQLYIVSPIWHLRQMEEAASAQRREIENNPRQNDTNLISTDIHLDKFRKRSLS